jgi:hypothetical protein
MVVLLILVIGLFAIMRLFPQGFASINYTANVTLADALAKHNEDYIRKFRENLMDGIVAVNPDNGLIRADLSPTDFLNSRPYPVAGNPDDPRFSDVNVARRVIGEHFKIPPPTIAWGGAGGAGQTVSLYRCLFSPIYSADPSGSMGSRNIASLGVLAYSGTPLQRIVFQNPPTYANRADLLQAGVFGYGIDYERGILYFFSTPYDRSFKVEYTYHPSPTQQLQTPPNNPITIPGDPNANPNPPTSPPGDPVDLMMVTTYTLPQAPDIGTDLLYRLFNRIANPADPFTADPYEFKVYDTVFGLFGFNPLAATVPLPRQEGRGLTARIDYDVDDWHIMRQDEVVPREVVDAGATGVRFHAVKLSTTRIKKVGEVEDNLNFNAGGQDTLEYQGLVRYYPDGPRAGTAGIDLVLVDIETGMFIDSSTLQKPGGVPATGNNSNGEIDYQAGIIHLRESADWKWPDGTSAGTQATGGRHVRIYYRTYNDFAVASFKPYSHYFFQPDPNLLGEREWAAFGAGYLLFANTSGEKSVSVDYTYVWNNQETRMEAGELHRISSPNDAGAPVPNRWWLQLSRATDPAVDVASLRVIGVRGASFHTRVVWREGARWRHMERSTILTREQTR